MIKNNHDKEFYNNARKTEFILSYSNSIPSRHFAKDVMMKFKKFEEDIWKCDLCRCPEKDLENVINHYFGRSLDSVERVFFLVKHYLRWCNNKGYEVNKNIINIKLDTIDVFKEQMVSNPQSLIKVLSEVFKPDSEEYIDVIYKTILLLAFSGMEDKDVLRVTVDNLDFYNGVIHFEGKEYPIYNEFRETFKVACNLQSFKQIHSKSGYRIVSRASGNLLIRTISSDGLELVSVRNYIMKRMGNAGKKITYSNIYRSGKYYRFYMAEMAGEILDFQKIINDEFNEGEYNISADNSATKVKNKKLKSLTRDYECWKEAFMPQRL